MNMDEERNRSFADGRSQTRIWEGENGWTRMKRRSSRRTGSRPHLAPGESVRGGSRGGAGRSWATRGVGRHLAWFDLSWPRVAVRRDRLGGGNQRGRLPASRAGRPLGRGKAPGGQWATMWPIGHLPPRAAEEIVLQGVAAREQWATSRAPVAHCPRPRKGLPDKAGGRGGWGDLFLRTVQDRWTGEGACRDNPGACGRGRADRR